MRLSIELCAFWTERYSATTTCYQQCLFLGFGDFPKKKPTFLKTEFSQKKSQKKTLNSKKKLRIFPKKKLNSPKNPKKKLRPLRGRIFPKKIPKKNLGASRRNLQIPKKKLILVFFWENSPKKRH